MKTTIVAKVALFNYEAKLLALRRSETDDRRPLQWDIPGGWVESGEDFAEAVAREIEEETGIKLSPKDLSLVFTEHAIRMHKDEPINVVWLFFIGKTKKSDVKLSFEHAEHTWMGLEEAIEEFKYPVQKALFKHLLDNDLLPD